jgi:hypothetical protein
MQLLYSVDDTVIVKTKFGKTRPLFLTCPYILAAKRKLKGNQYAFQLNKVTLLSLTDAAAL